MDMGTLNGPLKCKASTCDVMYTVDSPLIYIMMVNVRNTVSPLPPQIFLHRGGAALYTISNGIQSEYKEKRCGLDSVFMSMSIAHI
jgi:hypothetical protein